MMLYIANAVIEDKGVNYLHIAEKFIDWLNGEPMGIGNHTYHVLTFPEYKDRPFEASKMVWKMSRYQSAANGGLMRTSIVGLFPKAVEECAANICRLAHYDPRCVGSCVIVSELIHALVYDKPVPSYHQIIDIGKRYDDSIEEFIDLAQNDDICSLELQDDDSMGYTLRTLAAALWAYWHARTFEEGLLAVVRAGGDADTNAAVACAILGAKFGFNAIPPEYVDGLINKNQLDDVILGMAEIIKDCNI